MTFDLTHTVDLAEASAKVADRAALVGTRATAIQGALSRVQQKCDRSLESFDFDERRVFADVIFY